MVIFPPCQPVLLILTKTVRPQVRHHNLNARMKSLLTLGRLSGEYSTGPSFTTSKSRICMTVLSAHCGHKK